LIHADTLDLQDTNAPSAQDHTHQSPNAAPFGIGPPAPHQEASIRHAQVERTAEQEYLAETYAGQDQDQSGQAELNDEEQRDYVDNAVEERETQIDSRRNSLAGDYTASAEDVDTNEAEADDAMDDDLLDKMSSSPSIEDG